MCSTRCWGAAASGDATEPQPKPRCLLCALTILQKVPLDLSFAAVQRPDAQTTRVCGQAQESRSHQTCPCCQCNVVGTVQLALCQLPPARSRPRSHNRLFDLRFTLCVCEAVAMEAWPCLWIRCCGCVANAAVLPLPALQNMQARKGPLGTSQKVQELPADRGLHHPEELPLALGPSSQLPQQPRCALALPPQRAWTCILGGRKPGSFAGTGISVNPQNTASYEYRLPSERKRQPLQNAHRPQASGP